MAIHSNEEAEPQPIDIQAWTEEATVAIGALTIASPGEAHGTTVSLQIPLDEHPAPRPAPVAMAASNTTPLYKRKEPLRRDSMKRREALLRGKEGSRRRQRWENDRLLANPYAEPPTAKDWEIRPTYPVHNVPYYLAPLWDAGLKRQVVERKTAATQAKASTRTVSKKPTEPGVVPRELREKLKKARGAKGLLMDLENEVRSFVERWEELERRAEAEGFPADPDSSDDEIVFVGRNGQMRDLRSPRYEDVERERMVFETLADDQSGTFGRWLVHHIGTYYGLRTWSVTRGSPARREAYIGLREPTLKAGRSHSSLHSPLPRPLWGMV